MRKTSSQESGVGGRISIRVQQSVSVPAVRAGPRCTWLVEEAVPGKSAKGVQHPWSVDCGGSGLA